MVCTRSPVAAKMALPSAGASAGSAGSPMPVGAKSDWMKCASTRLDEKEIRKIG